MTIACVGHKATFAAAVTDAWSNAIIAVGWSVPSIPHLEGNF